MKIALVNYALPKADLQSRETRWWHKSGSRCRWRPSLTACAPDFPQVRSLYDNSDNHDHRSLDDAHTFAEMMGRQGLRWVVLTRAGTSKDRSIDRETWCAYRRKGQRAVGLPFFYFSACPREDVSWNPIYR